MTSREKRTAITNRGTPSTWKITGMPRIASRRKACGKEIISMNIEVFENPEFGKVRMANVDGRVLFCGKDVAEALGYVNTRKAIADHCKGVTKRDAPTASGVQQMSFITEGDLYRLIVSSKLESAQRFETWVFDEVLPSIRSNGGYMVPISDETPEQTMARALLLADATIRRQTAEIDSLRPKALVGEAVETSKASYTVTEAVRYIAQLNPSVRRQQVFDMLRATHMMVSRGTAPTRAGIDTGRMVAVLYESESPDGRVISRQQGRITGKGLAWLVSRFVSEGVA